MIVTKNKFIIPVLLVFVASSSMSYAVETTWDFQGTVESSGNNFGNQLTVDNDGDGNADLTIEAWANTGCGWYCGDDNHVEQGYAATNSWGLLNYNLDTSNGNITGESHTIDNNNGDTDMMLFSFAESIALTGINLSWASGSDISIAAFSQLPSLSGQTWTDIVGTSIYHASFDNIGLGLVSLVDKGVVAEAQYWLIGAYNAVFNELSGHPSSSDDAFKIASITTEPALKDVTGVSEPSTIAMLASFGMFLMWRRKKTA